ncbi:MAG: hypothetical protein E7634_01530 [Ruminococcaceae bacterium]|nr:hypothetical protein [Oscillospiraceae bacterium]
MKKCRFLLLILCLCLLLPIAACKKEEGPELSDYERKYDDLTRETARDSIPEGYDLDGAEIGVFYAAHQEKGVIGDGEATDIVYSKIYERNLSVAERLNCELEFISSNTTAWQDVTGVLKSDIQTMSDAYQIVFTTNNTVIQEKLFNYFHDLNDSEYIDISETRWWYEDAIMELSVDNYNYRFLYGEINIDSLGNAGAIFYNKGLYEQYLSPNKDAEDLYQQVLSGTWTFEKLYNLTKKAHIEKGGDGSNDIHGFMLIRYAEPIHYFVNSCGLKFYQRNEQGMPELTIYNDEAISFTEDLYKFIFENEGAFLLYPNMVGMETEYPNMFSNERIMFNLSSLSSVLKDEMREMKTDFGILPFPKYTEDQEMYLNFMANGTVATCIPVSCDFDYANEEVSAVIEALASESYRYVSVAFYEAALKSAYNRDDLSSQMIDIICGQHDTVKSTLTKNFVYEYGSSLGGMGSIFSTLMQNKNTNFASEYDSRLGQFNQGLRDLIEQYKSGKI